MANESGNGPTNDAPDHVDASMIAYQTSRMLSCIVCGKVPERAMAQEHEHPETTLATPYAATKFYTHGHYGSTFWDSFDGEQVCIVICDAHLEAATPDRIAFLRPVRQHPTRYREIERSEAE